MVRASVEDGEVVAGMGITRRRRRDLFVQRPRTCDGGD